MYLTPTEDINDLGIINNCNEGEFGKYFKAYKQCATLFITLINS